MFSNYIQGTKGPIFITIFQPESQIKDWIIYFPPFADEMNKSRRMIAAQARAWVDKGIAVLVPDLFGTGDSYGDFKDASWETWLRDIEILLDYLKKADADKIHFWGLRHGCLLALEAAERLSVKPQSMIFWQPIQNGNLAMTQFLRLRMAASMMGGKQEKVSDLREKLIKSGSLEVAGYELSNSLFQSIDQLNMLAKAPKSEIPISWFEIGSKKEVQLQFSSKKVLETWQGQGVDIETTTVTGEPFWITQELVMVPGLIKATIEETAKYFTDSKRIGLERVKEIFSEELDIKEQSVQFNCNSEHLAGILHSGSLSATRGMLLVVGGPQYRVGSHRQFVLLARDLANNGIPVFRFDYRGLGDSSGELIGFEGIRADIKAAIDCFTNKFPNINEIVLWGLCDAATASAFYSIHDQRVKGLVLLNPWVRSAEGEAKAYIKHYYLSRVISKEFWCKLFSGSIDMSSSIRSFISMLDTIIFSKNNTKISDGNLDDDNQHTISLAQKMYMSLKDYKGNILIILSGNDLTAAEFSNSLKNMRQFKKLLSKSYYQVIRIDDADHTFSRRVWRDHVSLKTIEWIKSW